MSEFVYHAPTKIIFESNGESKVGELIKEFGGSNVLVHYGSDRIKQNGLLNKVLASLTEKNIKYITLGGVVPNPRLSKVNEGIEICKNYQIDFILAVGGGSVIDSAKAIGIGACYNGDVWDFFDSKAVPTSSLPISSVLTIPASGSEMSNSIVITNENGDLKRGHKCNHSICKFSILNTDFTLSLPQNQTINGVVDILMHTMERYFHPLQEFDINDRIAEGLMLSVMENGLILLTDPTNIIARQNIMWAGSLSHNNLTGCGSNGGDWSSHQLEHELSGMFDVPHGAGLSTVWASWARYVINAIPNRFSKFAIRVMGIKHTGDDLETGLLGIFAMENYFKSIGSPTSIKELLGKLLTDDEIAELAVKCTYFGKRNIGYAKVLKENDIANIYKMMNI